MMKGKNKKYLRDGRAPIPTCEATSRVMSANKAKDTRPELKLRKALWAAGLRGYRTNWKKAPGRPDIAFPSRKIAIFVNGCFWHACSKCKQTLPKSNRAFWNDKFKKNKERDVNKVNELKKLNWTSIVVWECEMKNNLEKVTRSLIEVAIKMKLAKSILEA